MYMVDALSDLRGYINWLDEKGLLRRVDEELSPVLEIPAVLRKIMYAKGPAVLFENIKGFPEWRVAGNLFINTSVFADAIGVSSLEEIGNRLVLPVTKPVSTGLLDKARGLLDMKNLAGFIPKKVGKARFTENIVEASRDPLDLLPAFKTWPKDGGRYLTFPLVVTRDPVKGVMNMGVYRVMLIDGEKAVIHWQVHKRGAQAFASVKNNRLPVAIVIGGDPGTLFTGVAPVPYPLDKYLFAGVVRGRGIEVYELPSGLLVPANAEVILEGYVTRYDLVEEGPFGDHFGYYDKPVEKYPVFHVERMYYRSEPIYYGTVVGVPPLEDGVIGKIVERVFLPFLKVLVPEIVDINFPMHGGFQGLVIVSIRKRYPGQAKKVMNALWGIGQTSLTKIIVVVDDDINIHDLDQVVWAVSTNVLPGRDVLVMPYAHTDALDPASIAGSYGGKLGIDATRKLPEENDGREWPELVREDPEVEERVKDVVKRILGGEG